MNPASSQFGLPAFFMISGLQSVNLNSIEQKLKSQTQGIVAHPNMLSFPQAVRNIRSHLPQSLLDYLSPFMTPSQRTSFYRLPPSALSLFALDPN